MRIHTGDWHWRVYEIQSGPDAGGYQMVKGPATWMYQMAEEISEQSIKESKNTSPSTFQAESL